MMIHDLHNLLQWRLLSGSHKFPGPDGGTCINEAAIVVAGLRYRSIGCISDCPPCFSRPISAYAIRLNDRMPDDLRQELLIPFVTRLAGTADTPEIERQRAELMVIRCVNDVLPIILRLYQLESCAVLCERATTRAEARGAANMSRNALCAARAANAAANNAARAAYADAADAATAAYAAYADTADAARTAYAAAAAANNASRAAANNAAIQRLIWVKAVAILDSALRIGKQADLIEPATILARAEAAKHRACVSA